MTLGLVVAAIMAFLLCVVAHWAVEVIWHGAMGPLGRYALGTACIGLPLAGWCATQATIAGWTALLAWAVITSAAGLGTVIAYAADRCAGMRRELRLMGTRDGEPGAR